ncbi:MAG: WGR domain-containing protein [Sphingomonas phyllosphaerae]|uniref:WGR domain-containing protein n=1 Tax=Sphingomonas phyllosphaerae TaxID=257003 RepID=UPI002FF67096
MTPDTLPYAPIELVARNPARGVHRRWRLHAARDLFGRVTVETAWGRIGAPGRTLVRSFAGEEEALRYVRGLLRRRAGAPRRLGTGYVSA